MDSGWVVEPDGIRVVVEAAEDAELTPELRQALDRLVRVIEGEISEDEPETEGFQVFRPRPKCPQACPNNYVCEPKTVSDCFYYVDCTITKQPCSPALY